MLYNIWIMNYLDNSINLRVFINWHFTAYGLKIDTVQISFLYNINSDVDGIRSRRRSIGSFDRLDPFAESLFVNISPQNADASA